MKKLLSFCIPTYNRLEYLKKALDSITSEVIKYELQDFIEICISDNASNDNTDVYIKEIQKFSSVDIIFERNTENIGPDRNYFKAVELSNSQYCCIFGSDDQFAKDEIFNLIKILKEGNLDLIVFNRIEFKKDDFEKKLDIRPALYSHITSKLFDTNDRSQLREYLSLSIDILAVFSYLSNIVFKKQRWDEIIIDESFFGTGYPHSYILLKILKRGAKLQYLTNGIVFAQIGNDTFSSNLVDRKLFDYKGYIKLADEIFQDDIELRSEFLLILRRYYSLIVILQIKTVASKSKWKNEIQPLLLKCGYTKIELKSLKRVSFFPNYFHLSKLKNFINKI